MIYLAAITVLACTSGSLALLLLLAERFLADYGECRVQVRAVDGDRVGDGPEKEFVVRGGGKLLDALLEERIFIPSACGGQGTCGFCKVLVLAGGGPVLPTELPHLTDDDMRQGARLACQIKIKEDMRLGIRRDFLSVREYRAVVTAARMLTHDTREIRMRLEDPATLDFRAGQYIQVRVPDGAELVMRAYSLCNPPERNTEAELLVRLIPGGPASTYLHRVREGEEVVFTGPYGEFVLDPDPAAEIVCVGGGCGMAPMRSIVRYLAAACPDRACRLFFGARSADDLLYRDDLEQLAARMPNLRVVFALSEPRRADDWDGETGFIHEAVERHLASGTKRQAFLCGPAPMIKATRGVLTGKGVSAEDIYADEF